MASPDKKAAIGAKGRKAKVYELASKPLTIPGSTDRAQGQKPCAPQIHVEAVPWRDMAEGDAIVQWDALAQWASTPNPFLESWYLLPALRAFDPEGRVQLLRFELDGTLAGILPLAREMRYYRHLLPQWCNWTHANCFLGAPLVAQGLEIYFWRALFGWADRHAGHALFLHLTQLPLDGPLHEAMREVLAEQRRPAALVHRETRAMLASDSSPEAYLEQALSVKKRKELRRQHRRLSELGDLHFERRTDAEGIADWTEEFLWLEASGWKGRAGSALASIAGTTALFTRALQGAAERDRLERLTLTLDGSPIAMLANFIAPPGAFSFKTAFDERYARYSPGVLLQWENLALLERDDIDWCDSCAAQDHPMIDHLWRERRRVGRYSIAIGGPARRTFFRAIAWAETRKLRKALR